MKRFVLFILVLALAATAVYANDERGLNLRLVPEKLMSSLPPAIMSSVNFSFDLPVSADVGSSVLIARSQGRIGSCSSWAVASELTRIERLRNNWTVGLNRTYFSPLYLYNQVNGGRDAGSSLYSNGQILIDRGCALYITFPHVDNYRIQPTASAHREAARYRISEFRNIPVNLDSVRSALAGDFGVIVSFHVYDNFDSYTGGIYKPSGPSGVLRDGVRFPYHGMLMVAYNDANRTLKILNSWGETWGEKGYMYISYDDLTTLIVECKVIVPKDTLPSVAVPPSNVQASKGSNRNKVVISWTNNSAEEYEVFRMTENEYYTSLGKTSRNFFEDTTAVSNRRYFYFVAAHKGEYMSELSFASEGWSNSNATEVPGIPARFAVTRQGNTVIASWQAVDNANLYQVYKFDDTLNDYILAGETNSTVFRMPLPKITGPVMTFFVLARNNNGQGLPSETAVLTFDDWNISEESEIKDFEVYRGRFYNFPIQRFAAIERQAKEYFKNRQDEFQKKFANFKHQAAANFRNQHNIFRNRIQGGK
ncbi:MAG: hypothetical protein FWD26_07870 [Treponema sp.]|nr:hypothetical protein [Treponema sp.]